MFFALSLAISWFLCYAVAGAASTPAGGSPFFIGGYSSFLPPIERKGVAGMVTWEELFGFCMVIIAVITLARQDNNKKR